MDILHRRACNPPTSRAGAGRPPHIARRPAIMSSVIQKERVRAGKGIAALGLCRLSVAMTMAAGVTVSGQVDLPEGSQLAAIRAETATAISGAPTNINLRVGSAAAGQ